MRKSLVSFSESLPLVRIPARSAVYRLGSRAGPSTAPLIRLGEKDWVIAHETERREGWAIVGDGAGRRHLVEVDQVPVECCILIA